MTQMPDPRGPFIDILNYAGKYNAYEMWAESPEWLAELLSPIHRHWASEGRLPEWIGLDALRALLFYEFRADRFQGGSEIGQERIRYVYAALRERLQG